MQHRGQRGSEVRTLLPSWAFHPGRNRLTSGKKFSILNRVKVGSHVKFHQTYKRGNHKSQLKRVVSTPSGVE